MGPRHRRLGLLCLATFVLACRPAAAPRPHTVAPPAVLPPVVDARARVDAALAQPPVIPYTQVDVTASFQSSAPLRIEPNPPAPGAIRIHDDWFPVRLLVTRDVPLEGDGPERWVAPCFVGANEPTSVIAVALAQPPTATPLGPAPTEQDRCVATHFAKALWGTHFLRLDVRLAATAVSTVAPRPSKEIEEDLALVSHRLANETDPTRSSRLVLLAGTLHLELAASKDRPAELDRARARFEEVLALAPTARATALFGMAVALDGIAPERGVVAYRALVCPSRFTATSPLALAQDHAPAYWQAWEDVHPTPIGTTTPPRAAFKGATGGPQRWDEETVYREPYEGCGAMEGADRASVAEAWRAIGRYHDTRDKAAGPFALNRAATAYARSVVDGVPSPFVRLALGRVLYEAQRYHEAARQLGAVLRELEGSSTPASRELRLRASQILASSLSYFDFEGPAASEPRIDRLDVLEVEPNPARAEEKLAVVFDRLADPAWVPASASYAPLVVLWTAWDLMQARAGRLAERGFGLFLQRWPLHRDAPVAAWERANALAYLRPRPATPGATEAAKVEADARAALAQYVGNTPWTAANAGDAEALARAVRIAQAAPAEK